MVRASTVVLAVVLAVLAVVPADAGTIDPFTTLQALSVSDNKAQQSTVSAPLALGGQRLGSIMLFGTGSLSLSIGSGAATYSLAASASQGGRIGWLWYVNPSAPVTPVDLTAGGTLNAFQIEVLGTTGPVTVQVDALDADMVFDSVATVVTSKPAQPLVFDFSSFIAPSKPVKVDFTRIIGVQLEFDLRGNQSGLLKLGPLTTVKNPASPAADKAPASPQ